VNATRQAERQRAPERVAVAGGVVGCGDAHLVGDAVISIARRACDQLGEPRRGIARCPVAPQVDLGRRQVAHLAQHVVELVGRRGRDDRR
jgi:hypothetical protein